MAFYDKFPYTNFQEINLDRIIKELMEVKEGLQFVIDNSSLKYADPIEWNITTQYQANTVVIDPATGIAYISTKPVPNNVQITDTGYWTKVFDLSALFAELDQEIETVDQRVTTLETETDTKINTLETETNAKIETLQNRTTAAENNISDLDDDMTAVTQNVTQQGTRIDTLESTVNNHTTQINTLNSVVATKASAWLAGKRCAIFGDSLSNLGDGINGTMWQFVKQTIPSVTLHDYAVGGATISDISGQIADQTLENIDIVFINCGTNDWQVGTSLETFISTLNGCINAVRLKNKACEIILIAMPYSYHADFSNNGQRNGANVDVKDMASVITLSGMNNNIPVINLYADGECNASNYQYMIDPSTPNIYVHPNLVFAELIGRKIVNRDFSTAIYPIERKITPNTGVTADTSVCYDPRSKSIRMSGTLTSPSTISGTQVITVGALPMPTGMDALGLSDFRLPCMNYSTGSTQCYIFYASNVIALGGTVNAGNVIVCNH